MFRAILAMEADTVWEYGCSKQTAFPLAKIDTINEETGDMNEESALSLVVYGVASLSIIIDNRILCVFTLNELLPLKVFQVCQ